MSNEQKRALKMTKDSLDILLYAHDGRGLGHVSRTVAIGMALRRLYPALKICVLTGCAQTNELLGPAPLEWLKLPSYQTAVVDGKSTGIDGFCGFSDRSLGMLRAKMIKELVSLLQPRLMLVDHSPHGKHRELLDMLTAPSMARQPIMVLGLRGVVGAVAQTVSPGAQALFKKRFTRLVWYGDQQVLGNEQVQELKRVFSTDPVECGYVCRLKEHDALFKPRSAVQKTTPKSCLISVPWQGEHTAAFLDNLAQAIAQLKAPAGTFQLFFGASVDQALVNRFTACHSCQVFAFGSLYGRYLAQSAACIVFGGYNSLTDILYYAIPALVIVREMRDQEQRIHLQLLQRHSTLITVQAEQHCSAEYLQGALHRLIGEAPAPGLPGKTINVNGAETSARYLASLLKQQ